LTEEDLDLIHGIWLEVSNIPARRKVHHRDVLRVALERLERDLRGQSDVMLDFYRLEHGRTEREGAGRPKESRGATRIRS
jgi:hypothetical protein